MLAVAGAGALAVGLGHTAHRDAAGVGGLLRGVRPEGAEVADLARPRVGCRLHHRRQGVRRRRAQGRVLESADVLRHDQVARAVVEGIERALLVHDDPLAVRVAQRDARGDSGCHRRTERAPPARGSEGRRVVPSREGRGERGVVARGRGGGDGRHLGHGQPRSRDGGGPGGDGRQGGIVDGGGCRGIRSGSGHRADDESGTDEDRDRGPGGDREPATPTRGQGREGRAGGAQAFEDAGARVTGCRPRRSSDAGRHGDRARRGFAQLSARRGFGGCRRYDRQRERRRRQTLGLGARGAAGRELGIGGRHSTHSLPRARPGRPPPGESAPGDRVNGRSSEVRSKRLRPSRTCVRLSA